MIVSYITQELIEKINEGNAEFFFPKWEAIKKALYEFQLTEDIKDTLIDGIIVIIPLVITLYLVFHWDELNDKYHFFQ